MSSNFLFVYGTLLEDFDNDMSQFLNQNSKFIAKGYFHGLLYMVSWYPGAILSDKQTEHVHGSVFELENKEVYKILDAYEGVGENYPKPNLFRKELITAYINNTVRVKAWVYVYNHSISNLTQIISGDFFKFKNNLIN